MKKPLCPNCKGEDHELLDLIKFQMHDMVKKHVALLVCKGCGMVFDPQYVTEHILE